MKKKYLVNYFCPKMSLKMQKIHIIEHIFWKGGGGGGTLGGPGEKVSVVLKCL